ncbi:MAG: hypothetical protein LBI05_06230 [Planctomycetaceae bacterium]|jgi:hypothetical protein|nr:hypothetical protein [Planctomycetaceae bacterium]
MKKGIILTACILLFCGGLVCWYLTAQTYFGVDGVLVFDESSIIPDSLLDRKLEECSERELLEMKVAVAQYTFNYVTEQVKNGFATFDQFIEAKVNLADAEIELYWHTGDQEALRTALQTKVESRKQQLMQTQVHHDVGSKRGAFPELRRAEMQLLDAVLEQKRVLANDSGLDADNASTVPPDIEKQEIMVEKPINYGKAIKVQWSQGDQVKKFSLVMLVRVRKQDEKKFDDTSMKNIKVPSLTVLRQCYARPVWKTGWRLITPR